MANAMDKVGTLDTGLSDISDAKNQLNKKFGPGGDAAQTWKAGSKIGGTSVNRKIPQL